MKADLLALASERNGSSATAPPSGTTITTVLLTSASASKHNNKPGLANVSTLVKDYEGHYDQLYAALKTKYGADALAPAGDENKKDK